MDTFIEGYILVGGLGFRYCSIISKLFIINFTICHHRRVPEFFLASSFLGEGGPGHWMECPRTTMQRFLRRGKCRHRSIVLFEHSSLLATRSTHSSLLAIVSFPASFNFLLASFFFLLCLDFLFCGISGPYGLRLHPIP